MSQACLNEWFVAQLREHGIAQCMGGELKQLRVTPRRSRYRNDGDGLDHVLVGRIIEFPRDGEGCFRVMVSAVGGPLDVIVAMAAQLFGVPTEVTVAHVGN